MGLTHDRPSPFSLVLDGFANRYNCRGNRARVSNSSHPFLCVAGELNQFCAPKGNVKDPIHALHAISVDSTGQTILACDELRVYLIRSGVLCVARADRARECSGLMCQVAVVTGACVLVMQQSWICDIACASDGKSAFLIAGGNFGSGHCRIQRSLRTTTRNGSVLQFSAGRRHCHSKHTFVRHKRCRHLSSEHALR
jgi:hypothetical protein